VVLAVILGVWQEWLGASHPLDSVLIEAGAQPPGASAASPPLPPDQLG
jgi:hypothetical protein